MAELISCFFSSLSRMGLNLEKWEVQKNVSFSFLIKCFSSLDVLMKHYILSFVSFMVCNDYFWIGFQLLGHFITSCIKLRQIPALKKGDFKTVQHFNITFRLIKSPLAFITQIYRMSTVLGSQHLVVVGFFIEFQT